jgi:hypothetical protein
MECWFDLERHLDAEIIGLRVGVHEIGPVLKKIVTNSRTGKTRKLSIRQIALVPAMFCFFLCFLRFGVSSFLRGAETWGYREFLFFRELGKVLASNSGRKNSAYYDEFSRRNCYYFRKLSLTKMFSYKCNILIPTYRDMSPRVRATSFNDLAVPRCAFLYVG